MCTANIKCLQDASSFPLLDLPAELWSRICKLAVIPDHDLEVQSYGFGLKRKILAAHAHRTLQQPSITRVNRAVRSEVLPFFYQSATFTLTGLTSRGFYKPWLLAMGKQNRASLRNLYVQHSGLPTGQQVTDYLGIEGGVAEFVPGSRRVKLSFT